MKNKILLPMVAMMFAILSAFAFRTDDAALQTWKIDPQQEPECVEEKECIFATGTLCEQTVFYDNDNCNTTVMRHRNP